MRKSYPPAPEHSFVERSKSTTPMHPFPRASEPPAEGGAILDQLLHAEAPSPPRRSTYVSSYLSRASTSVLYARALARRARREEELEGAFRGFLRAIEQLARAVRVAHGLSATTLRDLPSLVDGAPARKAPPLPPESPWREPLLALVPLTTRDEPPSAEELVAWGETLETLVAAATTKLPNQPRRGGRLK